MSKFEFCFAKDSDNAQLQTLYSLPQPSLGMQIAFERAPSYFKSEAVMYNQGQLLLIKDKSSKNIAAAVNMGKRKIYINGVPQWIRYGADVRVAKEYQGSRALFYINRAVKETIGSDWYLTLILTDNKKSQKSFEDARAGFPFYRHIDNINTYTITSVKKITNSELSVRPASINDITKMNKFVSLMSSTYQFLPCYDFNEIQAGSSFYSGLNLDDFILVERNGELLAMAGLWDQHNHKQARVLSYQPLLKTIRPFYNLYSYLTGGIHLPRENSVFKYRTLHSFLVKENESQAAYFLLSELWKKCKYSGAKSMVLTLADNDTRKSILPICRYSLMSAKNYSVAFDEQDQPSLNKNLISYYESGRI